MFSHDAGRIPRTAIALTLVRIATWFATLSDGEFLAQDFRNDFVLAHDDYVLTGSAPFRKADLYSNGSRGCNVDMSWRANNQAAWIVYAQTQPPSSLDRAAAARTAPATSASRPWAWK